MGFQHDALSGAVHLEAQRDSHLFVLLLGVITFLNSIGSVLPGQNYLSKGVRNETVLHHNDTAADSIFTVRK
jgi:hypothetical protein